MSERKETKESRSKLDIVRDSLATNERFEVVSANEGWSSNNNISHFVDFYIAPKESIYDPKKLQRELKKLIPIKPTMIDDFSSSETGLRVGVLYFDQEGITIVNTTREYIQTFGPDQIINESSQTEKRSSLRRVWVRLYPSIEIAKLVLENEQKDISDSTKKYGLGFFIPNEVLKSA